tara:strand:+ start:948 stop:2399 length:1452 start_codon:yes stop_codon:yes gene_type:complete
MKKKIVIKLGDITKRVISEHQLLKKEQNRIRSLNEQIEYDERHPERMNPSIEDSLRQGRHTFGKSKGLPVTGNDQNYSEKLASARFKDIINKVKRYHGIDQVNPQMMMEMMRIMGEVAKIEAQHKDELEQLAIDIVSEEFDIPDDMLDAELLPPGSPLDLENDEEDGDEEEPEEFQPQSAERMEELEIEVDKRNIINALMQGASKKGHYIFHMVADELDQIDPRLMGLYGKLMSLADFQYWIIPDQAMGGQIGGTEKIKWVEAGDENEGGEEDEDLEMPKDTRELEPRIEAKAWIFPLLVHELIKGSMELAASNWGEGHLDFEEQKHVIQRADTIEGEIWGMRLGPGMWEKFVECIDPEDYSIKQWLFHELTKLPADKFMKFIKEILSQSGKCSEVISHLKELHEADSDEELEDFIMGDEDNFEDGLDDLMVDAGVEDPIIPQQEEPREIDYSEMSKREIESLIDDALDAGDIDTVEKLHKYL